MSNSKSKQILHSFQTEEEAFFWLGGASTNAVAAFTDRSCDNDDASEAAAQRRLWVGGASYEEIDECLQTLKCVHPRPPRSMPTLNIPSTMQDCLVFDTETTGLGKPIVCQLAYILVRNGSVSIEYDHLLRLPPGVFIERQAQRVHKITTRRCAQTGVDAADALKTFSRHARHVLDNNGRVIAHNGNFDVRAIRTTLVAWSVADGEECPQLHSSDIFCTMRHSKPHSPLVDRRGRTKAFKNDELYSFLRGEPPSFARLHCAIDDVRVTLLNYIAAHCRGWW
tara:strand:- start:55 stop:897 length:843 start_codon:yes stop_codon:yes gene_type:complete